MGAFSAGSVVFVPFPFSDLTQSKVRPAICLAAVGRNDWILCQVTSKPYGDPSAVQIDAKDFAQGGLTLLSFARPGKLFTANTSLFVNLAGSLQAQSLTLVIDAVFKIIRP
jgi:mRNA interferase MazF